MAFWKKIGKISVGVSAALLLAACGNGGNDSDDNSDGGESDGDNFSAVIVTDVGGVDDKSFNQGAWEGLTEWGKENGKEQGNSGYAYIQSDSESDYITNLNSAVSNGFNLIFGVGYKLVDAIKETASNNPDTHFAIIDEVIDADNVASVTFKDNEAAFLAGVAAANETKVDKVGFIGGAKSPVIDRFEAGFVAGVKAVNPDIDIVVEYVNDFGDAAKGKQLAAAMYADGADIIYQAAGGSGNGVFSEAKDIVKADPSREIWVIGVDRDQTDEGVIGDRNVTLTSTTKGVGVAVKNLTEESAKGNFPGGEHQELGLADDGVGLTNGQLSDDTKTQIEDFKKQIIDGSLEVSEKP